MGLLEPSYRWSRSRVMARLRSRGSIRVRVRVVVLPCPSGCRRGHGGAREEEVRK